MNTWLLSQYHFMKRRNNYGSIILSQTIVYLIDSLFVLLTKKHARSSISKTQPWFLVRHIYLFCGVWQVNNCMLISVSHRRRTNAFVQDFHGIKIRSSWNNERPNMKFETHRRYVKQPEPTILSSIFEIMFEIT